MGSNPSPIRYTALKGSSSGKIIEAEFEKSAIGSNEVLLEMLYSGVCGTDAHMLNAGIVLGHEGVGMVKQLGCDVKHLNVGDRVGMGLVRGGCNYCSACLSGYSWWCETSPNNYGFSTDPNQTDTATWSSHAVVPAHRLAKIPAEIPSEFAGPLMCAGQTVFLPLARTDVRPWDTIGVVGIGGLGHLAIQFAAKMGCKVIVFSGTANKKDEAFKLGAHEFYTASDLKEGTVPKGVVHHLLVTTSQVPDWTLYEPVLANQAHIFPLTISNDDFKINMTTLVSREISIHGICASTVPQINQMLDFAARHKIRPMIEEFPMTQEGAQEAMTKLDKGQLRYRAVLKV